MFDPAWEGRAGTCLALGLDAAGAGRYDQAAGPGQRADNLPGRRDEE